jgi:hypothetical protein
MAPRTLLFVVLALTALGSRAQTVSLEPHLNPDNPRDWGPAAEHTLATPAVKAGIPVTVEVRFMKRMALVCQYEYRVTNNSNRTVGLKMFAVSEQKYNQRITAGQSVVFSAASGKRCGGKEVKGEEACLACEPPFTITEVYFK